MIVFVQSIAICIVCIFALEKSRQVDVLLSKQTRQQLEFQSGVGELRFQIRSLENEISKITKKSEFCEKNLELQNKKNEEIVHKIQKSCLQCKKANKRLEKQRFRSTVKVYVPEKIPLHQEKLENIQSRVSSLRQIAIDVENDILKKFTNLTHKLQKEKSSRNLLNQKSSTCSLTQISSNSSKMTNKDENHLPDFASEHCGARIIKETGTYKKFWGFASSPSRFATIPDNAPGKCWPCRPPCELELQLCFPTNVSAFSIHHIPRSVSPSPYGITSAPREITLHVSNNSSLSATFDVNGPPKQTFNFPNPFTELTKSVKLVVSSNWGHPEVACIYKIDIH